jgi:hypothetical protein
MVFDSKKAVFFIDLSKNREQFQKKIAPELLELLSEHEKRAILGHHKSNCSHQLL